MSDFDEVERALKYVFKNKQLLKKALTLSSYDNDNNNESLECLGDAILSFLVAEEYYKKGLSEGEITEEKQLLLSDEALRPVSERLGLDKALLRDKGDNRNKKAVPSAYEAIVAAIYLDGGLAKARKFALSTLTPRRQAFNYVGALQELLQADGEPLPHYSQYDTGTPQSPYKRVEVTVRGKTFRGEGVSVSEAKRGAAKKAYEYFRR